MREQPVKLMGGIKLDLSGENSNSDLPDNRAVAEKRLHLLEKCLESDPELPSTDKL